MDPSDGKQQRCCGHVDTLFEVVAYKVDELRSPPSIDYMSSLECSFEDREARSLAGYGNQKSKNTFKENK